jgi:hypothetical protein
MTFLHILMPALRFMDCNGVLSDGCEINLNTDINNCGTCGNVVSLPNAADAACVAGAPSIAHCSTG